MAKSSALFNFVLIGVIAIHSLFLWLCCIPPAFLQKQLSPRKTPPQRLVVQTIRDLRDLRDQRDQRDSRDSRDLRDQRDSRDSRDQRDTRDKRDLRDARDQRDPKGPRDLRDKRDSRDKKDIVSAKQSLLMEARNNLAKVKPAIDNKPAKQITQKKSIALHSSQLIGTLQSESFAFTSNQAFLSSPDDMYQNELIDRLKRELKLPEYGNVTIKLTLLRSGQIFSLAILNEESFLNRQYVEKAVPALLFPAFGNSFENKSEQTFIITLSGS